jgi:hypothetical protein
MIDEEYMGIIPSSISKSPGSGNTVRQLFGMRDQQGALICGINRQKLAAIDPRTREKTVGLDPDPDLEAEVEVEAEAEAEAEEP